MMTFWFIASGLTIVILGLLVWPLLKGPAAVTAGEQEKKLSVYRQQFAELEQDHRSGVLTDEQYQVARRELERRVLEETGAEQGPSTGTARHVSGRAVALALAIVLPTVSGLLYVKLGSPSAITHSTIQEGSEADVQSMRGLEALTERLKAKLEQNPTDGVGWALLARAYVELGRHPEAVPIYEKAMQDLPAADSPYASVNQRVGEWFLQSLLTSLPTAEDVAGVVAEVVSADQPDLRYPVGADAESLIAWRDDHGVDAWVQASGADDDAWWAWMTEVTGIPRPG